MIKVMAILLISGLVWQEIGRADMMLRPMAARDRMYRRISDPPVEEIIATIKRLIEIVDRLAEIAKSDDPNSERSVNAVYDLLQDPAIAKYPNPSILSRNEGAWEVALEFQDRPSIDNGDYYRSPAEWMRDFILSGHAGVFQAVAAFPRNKFISFMRKAMRALWLEHEIRKVFPGRITEALGGYYMQHALQDRVDEILPKLEAIYSREIVAVSIPLQPPAAATAALASI